MSNFANGPKRNWNDEPEYRGGGGLDRGRDRDGPPLARGPPRDRDRDDGPRGLPNCYQSDQT